MLNTGIKVIHHELSEVQPDYSSLPPSCAVGGVGGWGGGGTKRELSDECGTRLHGDASCSAAGSDLDAISTEVRSRCDLDLDGGQACTGEAGACESRGCGGGRVGWRCERCGCRCAVECSLSIVREPYERTLPWSQDLRLSDQCCAGAAANLGVRKLYRSIQGWWGHR